MNTGYEKVFDELNNELTQLEAKPFYDFFIKLYCSNSSLRDELEKIDKQYYKLYKLVKEKGPQVERLYELLQILKKPEIKLLMLFKELDDKVSEHIEDRLLFIIVGERRVKIDDIFHEFDELLDKIRNDNENAHILDNLFVHDRLTDANTIIEKSEYRDTLCQYTENGGKITVTKFVGFDDVEIYAIPEKINGLPVTEIGEGAFENCQAIKEILLPDTIVSIAKHAFYRSGLSKINLTNVESIGYEAFCCSRIQEIVIPTKMTEISAKTFAWSELKKITIEKGIIEIGMSAFELCRFVEKIDIPEGVVKILPSAFFGVKHLKVRIPNSVRLIGGEKVFDKSACIYCNSGSYAMEYARTYGLKVHRYEDYDLL